MHKVKFITKNHGKADWLRQIPDATGRIGDSSFVFDPGCRDYDWLVVYDDFPKRRPDGSAYQYEPLACPADNTILVTSEPASIKRYESAYIRQFGRVVTSQLAGELRHPGAVRAPSTSLWYYGQGGAEKKTVDSMRLNLPEKNALLSTVCSDKKQKHTLHFKRWTFTQALKAALPELEIFGHGVRPMQDKAEAMDDFRYHIAIENHFGDHHWTEKLSDCFLAGCLPFYYGCPNAEHYFPAESFIRIDINDPQSAVQIIQAAMREDAYAARLDAIQEARRRVMGVHNLFFRLNELICQSGAARSSAQRRGRSPRLYSRHRARARAPFSMLRDLCAARLR